MQSLIVKRADLRETEIVVGPEPDLAEGEALLRIDRFALTANNITYAVAPERLGYWHFFPVDREGWGQVPVWGFADVVASLSEVQIGARYYGYFPMASHLVIQPGRVRAQGMIDAASHRAPMAAIYNQYQNVAADPAWASEREGMIALFRPLFTTSFLLDVAHRKADMYGAQQVVLGSASSKTALGLAFLLHRAGVRTVGLTSAGNVAFCEGLGVYDDVVTYDAVSGIARVPTAFVDMSGSGDVLRAVHAHFGDTLKSSCRVGLTHWQDMAGQSDSLEGGPEPYFFFAPTYAEEMIAEWGRAGFAARLADAWGAFIGGAAGWLRVRETAGPEAVEAQYQEMLEGRIDPADGHVLRM